MQVTPTPTGTQFHQALGLRWEPAGPDDDAATVTVALDLREDLRGPAGSLEGGILATLVDVAGASCAARSLQSMVATQQMSISFLAPGRVGPVRATASPLRVARDHAVVDVRVIDSGNNDRLLTAATITVVALRPRE